MSLYLQEQKVDNAMLCAFDFIRVGTNREVDIEYIEQKLDKQLKLYPGTHLFITQGSICKNAFGETDYLKQGGSDYTAALIGVALHAKKRSYSSAQSDESDGGRNLHLR